MNKQIPSYLKLVTDTNLQTDAESEDSAAFVEVCRAFERATGWNLDYSPHPPTSENSSLMWAAPVDPGVGNSPGHIGLSSTAETNEGGQSPVTLAQAGPLATAIGKLWAELQATRLALKQREAELATGVPLVVRDDQTPSLCDRLEAVLRGGAEAVGADAAALYLLDDTTTELKLRACWGLPQRRLVAPSRPLRGALGDLEALLGHAVVLSDEMLHDYWKVPERGFAACVCVPVSSPTMPLGTLWIFSHTARDFSDAQTNIVEVVAGRLAADLEREVLLGEARAAKARVELPAIAPQVELPRAAPMVDGWEIAAGAYHAGSTGGTFYDWFERADGCLAIVAGDTRDDPLQRGLTAATLRGAARAFDSLGPEPHLLLERANSVLWTGTSGHASAGLFQAFIEPKSDSFSFAMAGPLRLLLLPHSRGRDHQGHLLAGPTAPLGSVEDLSLSSQRRAVQGDLLLLYGTSFVEGEKELLLAALDQRLADAIGGRRRKSAADLLKIADDVLRGHPARKRADRLLLLVKHRLR